MIIVMSNGEMEVKYLNQKLSISKVVWRYIENKVINIYKI